MVQISFYFTNVYSKPLCWILAFFTEKIYHVFIIAHKPLSYILSTGNLWISESNRNKLQVEKETSKRPNWHWLTAARCTQTYPSFLTTRAAKEWGSEYNIYVYMKEIYKQKNNSFKKWGWKFYRSKLLGSTAWHSDPVKELISANAFSVYDMASSLIQ